jgi:hypothetical protein
MVPSGSRPSGTMGAETSIAGMRSGVGGGLAVDHLGALGTANPRFNQRVGQEPFV